MARCNRTVRQHTRNPRYDDLTIHIFNIEAYKLFVQFRKITTKMHADVENLVDSSPTQNSRSTRIQRAPCIIGKSFVPDILQVTW